MRATGRSPTFATPTASPSCTTDTPLMEAGNHGELIMTDGSYAELYSLQAAGNYRPADEVD